MSEGIKLDPQTSCPYAGRILEFYQDTFEAVFIALHPFLKEGTLHFDQYENRNDWPTDALILKGTSPVSWGEVLGQSDFTDYSEIDRALRDWVLSLKKPQPEALAKLDRFLKASKLVEPFKGELSPHLKPKIGRFLRSIGFDDLHVCDEFGAQRRVIPTEHLEGAGETPMHGNIFPHDHSCLVTTHWDSHCSFICGDRKILEALPANFGVEGFFVTDQTEVYWGLHPI